MIAIQVSLYPLGKDDIDIHLKRFWDLLRQEGIDFRVTPMSTLVYGQDEEKIYDSLFRAYRSVRKESRAVMVTTLTTGNKQEIDKLLGFL